MLESEALTQGIDVVELLPGEELYFEGEVATAVGAEVLGYLAWLTAEVPIAGCLAVDRCAELEALLDGVGTEVEELAYTLCVSMKILMGSATPMA